MSVFLRIDMNLCATLYLGIVFYLAYRRLDHEDKFNRLFFKGCLAIMILTTIEAITCVMNHNPSALLRWVSTGMHLFLFAFPPLITYYWYLLADTLTSHGNVQEMRPQWAYLIPVGFVAAITLLSPVFRLVYYIDEQGVYHRGPLFVVVLIISYSYLLMGFLLLLKRRKNMVNMDFAFLALFCLLPMIGGLVQGLLYGVLLMWPCSAFALTIMYLYLQERMIQSDPLTGAWAKHSFEYYLAQRLKCADPAQFGLAYIDMDNLKHINDSYGHQEGDAAIRSAVAVIKGVLRKGDVIARLGGDEFALFLKVTTRDQLDAVLERIDAAMRTYNGTSGKAYILSFSLGAELFDASEIDSAETALNKVDQLMYANKSVKHQLPAGRRMGESSTAQFNQGQPGPGAESD